MKICVTAAGSTLGASVDPRVGRATYFIIVDSETMSFEAVTNTVARRNQSFLTSSSVWTLHLNDQT